MPKLFLFLSIFLTILLPPWQMLTSNGTGDGLTTSQFYGWHLLWTPPAVSETAPPNSRAEINLAILLLEDLLLVGVYRLSSKRRSLSKLNLSSNWTVYAIIAVTAIAITSTAWAYLKQLESMRWTEHTYMVLESLNEVQARLLRLNILKRDTQQDNSRDRFNQALSEVKHYTSDNPSQQKDIIALNSLVDESSTDSEQRSRKIEVLVNDMKKRERQLLLDRLSSLQSSRDAAAALTLFFGSLSVTLLLATFKRLRQSLKVETEKTSALELEIARRKQVEQELELAAVQLKRSNDELQQFAYVASHDLQEPLRAVTGFLTLLLKQSDNQLTDSSKVYIGHAVDGAARMKALIQDLLAFARVETRGLDFREVDLNRTLEEVQRDLGELIKDSSAQLMYSELPRVQADPTQVRQLFSNLISNAIKFRGDTAPVVNISYRTLPENDMMEFSVADNGRGFEMQHADRIFVIFQRLQSRDEVSGTGIGLALCKKIVERHGGSIRVESRPGIGTTFYFTLLRSTSNNEVTQPVGSGRTGA